MMDTGVEDVIAFRRIEWIFVLIWRGGQEARVNPAEYIVLCIAISQKLN